MFRKVIINSNGAIKVWWGTKLRSHKKKDFPNEQNNNNRYLLIFSLIMLYLKGEPSIFFKIEVKFKIKYLLPKDFVCVD